MPCSGRWNSGILSWLNIRKEQFTMEQLQLWNEDIKSHNSLQGDDFDIGNRANSRTLTEEDIRILTFASNPLEENVKEELQFDQNVFKKPSIYETLG